MLQLKVTVLPARTDFDSGSLVNLIVASCSVYGKTACAGREEEKQTVLI